MNSRTVKTARRERVRIDLPPSKSYTARALIAASLACGDSTIRNASRALDTKLLIDALRQFGVGISADGDSLTVRGTGGQFERADRILYLGNAGTALRFMASFASIAPGTTILEGDTGMNARPMADLVDALEQTGVRVSSNGGRTPLRIEGGTFRGGKVSLNAGKSSQFLSSLLLCAPYTGSGLDIGLINPASSLPYIGMTLRVMAAFGVSVRPCDSRYKTGKSLYTPADFTVEPDVSGSTFFASAAAITGSTVEMPGVSDKSLQGDLVFYTHIEKMGCRVVFRDGSVEVSRSSPLGGIEADLNQAPDSVPPLAVTAAFAEGPSVISNIGHLAYKETDRLSALASELPKIGTAVARHGDGLRITPGRPVPAVIDTYNDHRIAMSFAVAGLKIDGMKITNPGCVGKSFPGFWNELEKFI